MPTSVNLGCQCAREIEDDIFALQGDFLDARRSARDDFDETFRGRCPGRWFGPWRRADQSMSAARWTRLATRAPARKAVSTRRREFDELGAPITRDGIGTWGDHLDGVLPVRRGVADIVLMRPHDLGEALLQGRDNGSCIRVDRKGRLGDVSEAWRDRQALRLPHPRASAPDGMAPFGSWPRDALDLGMAGMADENDLAALREESVFSASM